MSAFDSHDLAAYIEQHGLGAELLHLASDTPTVEAAAQALGVDTDEIIKSLVFMAGGSSVVVVASGTRPVSSGRLAALLGIDPSDITLAPPKRVLESTGYPVGAVPPFGHKAILPTLMDSRIFDHEWVYGGGGEISVLVKVRPEAIRRATQARIVDLHTARDTRGD